MSPVEPQRIDALYEKLKREAEASGYNLNPDVEFTKSLVEGLLANEDRYGYQSCPCRLASGDAEQDLDIVCPCDYRDADLSDFGACYCALYVSDEIAHGIRQAESIPERRPPGGAKAHNDQLEPVTVKGLPYPIWRCKVCGYLCARPDPPQTCPICHVKKERFERFI